MQSDSVDQQDLMRTAKADEDNYLLYLRKREEARIGDALDERRILNVAIVEPPAAPALPTHSVLLYFLLAFGLAMAFSVGMAFTAEYFDPTIRTPDEAHAVLEVPVLAWLPAPEPAGLRPSSVSDRTVRRWWSSEHLPRASCRHRQLPPKPRLLTDDSRANPAAEQSLR